MSCILNLLVIGLVVRTHKLSVAVNLVLIDLHNHQYNIVFAIVTVLVSNSEFEMRRESAYAFRGRETELVVATRIASPDA